MPHLGSNQRTAGGGSTQLNIYLSTPPSIYLFIFNKTSAKSLIKFRSTEDLLYPSQTKRRLKLNPHFSFSSLIGRNNTFFCFFLCVRPLQSFKLLDEGTLFRLFHGGFYVSSEVHIKIFYLEKRRATISSVTSKRAKQMAVK